MVWTIPQGGLQESSNAPTLTLTGHGRKVGHVLFNPVAENILATSSADMTVKIWDISTGQEKFELANHAEIIQSISWSWQGNNLATCCKDKKLRIFDVRTKGAVQETGSHQGVKGSRVVTMGDSPYLCTTGFARSSERQIFIWDSRSFAAPIKQEQVDTASGLLIPTFDADTNMLYIAGKGDGNIRYYEWVEEEKTIHYLSEYKSSDPLRGLCFLPKRALNINECEVARIYKVHPTFVEPISFKVPRKADGFQSDLFPLTPGGEPAMSSKEWLGGKTCGPKMINLEHGYTPAAPKEFVTSAPTADTAATPTANAPMSEKEYQDAYHSLRKEAEELKNMVAARDTRIRQLEAQLASLGK
ncbi:Coronin-2B [Kappamyces sp. JEL0829]|nr:Coronin-2B [Kappamyces sp. JEL0829]